MTQVIQFIELAMGRPQHAAPDLRSGRGQHRVHCATLAQGITRVENKLRAIAVADSARHGSMVAQHFRTRMLTQHTVAVTPDGLVYVSSGRALLRIRQQ